MMMRNCYRLAVRRIAVLLLAAALLFGCLATATAAEPAVPEGAVLPDWFSFPESTLSLYNESNSVGRQYYVDVFGPMKGSILYDYFESMGSHGLCYGISFAEGAVLSDSPSLGSFRTPDGASYGSVSQLKKGSVSDPSGLPLMSMIKYAYVTQASSEVSDNFERTKNDAAGLRAAVFDFVYHGGPPVAVGLLGNIASHEVLAVGLLGKEDIVISDSNDPARLYVMDFTGNDWSYRCGGYHWYSGSADFDYCTGILSVMARFTGGKGRIYSDQAYKYDAAEESGAETDVFRTDVVRCDAEHMLLMVPEGFHYTPKDIVKYIGSGDSSYFDVDYEFDYLWAEGDKALVTRNDSDEFRTLVLLGNDSGLLSAVRPGDVAAVTVTENQPSLLLNGRDGQEALIACLRPSEDDDPEFLVVTGTMDGGEIYATSDANRLYVSGMSDVTATVETVSGSQSAPVRSSGGEFLVSGAASSGVHLTLLGDADGDGNVTSADARVVLRCSVRLESTAAYDALACDYDMDAQVTAADARLILRRSVGLRD